MRVLVTGGTGYLGQAIVRALVRRGHAPVVFSRKTSQENDLRGPISSAERPLRSFSDEAVFITGDVRDRDALVAAARGCDAMIHSAALVTVWRPNPRDFDDVNVGGLRHALEAVRTHGLQRMVYTSSFLALPPAGQNEAL